jgi:NADPH:quinone reductase-like Zn-dependent oxidoreductase
MLITVRAASVNRDDWKARRGLPKTRLPAVLGLEIAGAAWLRSA